MKLNLYKIAIGTKESEWYSIYTVSKTLSAAKLLVLNILQAVGTSKKLIIRKTEKLNDVISSGEVADNLAIDFNTIFKEYEDTLKSLEESK